MRVEPELPQHPKFVRLKKRIGDEAMEVLIRLWGHCQQNQRGEFWPRADADYVETIAVWDGEPGLLFRTLLELGWMDREEGGIRLHDWDEMNAQFVKNWANGRHGGRPKKPASNQSETSLTASERGESQGPKTGQNVNQSETSRKPVSNQMETDRTKPNLTEPNSSEEDRAVNQSETSRKPASGLDFSMAREVLQFLNEKTGAAFLESPGLLHTIASRLQETGNDLEGVRQMIARQVACWRDDGAMNSFLRPATLFEEEKFANYFGQRQLPVTGPRTSHPGDRQKELREKIEQSPANRQSVFHNPNASETEKTQLKNWRRELEGGGSRTGQQVQTAGR